MYEEESAEPVSITPIDDGDATLLGWQTPEGGLAIHDLVWKHRPVVHVHEDETGEPTNIEDFILCSRNGQGDAANDPGCHGERIVKLSLNDQVREIRLDNGDNAIMCEQCYFDLFNDNMPTLDAMRVTQAQNRTIYYSVNHTDAENFVFLQYWMFSNFSSQPFFSTGRTAMPPIQHEGDLEYVQIAVALQDPRYGDEEEPRHWIAPFAATASQHFYGQTLEWNRHNGTAANGTDAQTHVEHTDNLRLAIYLAFGAHATYFAQDDNIPVPRSNAVLGTQAPYNEFNRFIFDRTMPADRLDFTFRSLSSEPILENFTGLWGHPDEPLVSFNNKSGPPGVPRRHANCCTGFAAALFGNDVEIFLRRQPRDLHNAARRVDQRTDPAAAQQFRRMCIPRDESDNTCAAAN